MTQECQLHVHYRLDNEFLFATIDPKFKDKGYQTIVREAARINAAETTCDDSEEDAAEHLKHQLNYIETRGYDLVAVFLSSDAEYI